MDDSFDLKKREIKFGQEYHGDMDDILSPE